MAKKKKDKKNGKTDPVEGVRSAVERLLSEGAGSTRERAREVVDEIAHAANRFKDQIGELRVLDDVKGLRAEVEALAKRVAALEKSQAAAKPAARRSTAQRKTTTRPTTRTRRSTSAAAKPSGSQDKSTS